MNSTDIKGNEVKVVDEEFTFRPAVYGYVEKNDKILIMKPSWDDKYNLIGGGMDLGETFHEALKREFLEEIGFEIEILDKQPMFVNTSLFALPEKNYYFQRINMYYRVKLKKENKKMMMNDDEVVETLWENKVNLKFTDFTHFQQEFAKEVL
jgi:8-oxo-dGTP diphosphatase